MKNGKLIAVIVFMMMTLSSCLIDLHNDERTTRGLPELTYNTNLKVEAQAVAERLAANCAGVGNRPLASYHTSKGGIKKIMTKHFGSGWTSANENIGIILIVPNSDQNLVLAMHEGYMGSQPHRESIISPKFNTASEGWAAARCNGADYTWNATLFVELK